jgi:hypothetical protein
MVHSERTVPLKQSLWDAAACPCNADNCPSLLRTWGFVISETFSTNTRQVTQLPPLKSCQSPLLGTDYIRINGKLFRILFQLTPFDSLKSG